MLQVPYFNAPMFLQNKTQIGKIEEIFGAINDEYVLFIPSCCDMCDLMDLAKCSPAVQSCQSVAWPSWTHPEASDQHSCCHLISEVWVPASIFAAPVLALNRSLHACAALHYQDAGGRCGHLIRSRGQVLSSTPSSSCPWTASCPGPRAPSPGGRGEMTGCN